MGKLLKYRSFDEIMERAHSLSATVVEEAVRVLKDLDNKQKVNKALISFGKQ